MRSGFVSTLIVISSVLVALLIAEGAAQLYVTHIAGKDRLFRTDTLLGWRPIAHLDITRKGPDGRTWRINTGDSGWRNLPAVHPSSPTGSAPSKTILLGDSYVFGQGIQVQERFDAVWAGLDSTLNPINLGVMGFGTDQQLLALQPFAAKLKPGDRAVLITHFNDLFDLLRREFSGRPKPWYELGEGGRLILHKPELDMTSWLRNRSYIYTRLAMFNEQRRGFPRAKLNRSVELYSRLVEEHLVPLSKQGVEVIIAYHGLKQYNRPAVEEHLENRINGLASDYDLIPVKLDSVLAPSAHYLSDGHWNTAGHRIVGEALHRISQ